MGLFHCKKKEQNGSGSFVEFIGATDRELRANQNKELDVASLYEKPVSYTHLRAHET